MKRVLITGANSYVGTNVEKWLMKEPENFYVETLDMRDPNWKNFDFSKFDVVFHVAGIAHIKERRDNRDLYFKVNRDLAVETAQISKESGVKHFIFMSSMSVYGKYSGQITKNTPKKPDNCYGISKSQAEDQILLLSDNSFSIAILRPPMIYGKNSPGNYKKLSKISKFMIKIPRIENHRSFIFIDNLCIFIRSLIGNPYSGVYFPQNKELISTSKMIKLIRMSNNLNYNYSTILGYVVKKLLFVPVIKKIFGDLYYEYDNFMDNIRKDLIDFEKTIEKTEDKT